MRKGHQTGTGNSKYGRINVRYSDLINLQSNKANDFFSIRPSIWLALLTLAIIWFLFKIGFNQLFTIYVIAIDFGPICISFLGTKTKMSLEFQLKIYQKWVTQLKLIFVLVPKNDIHIGSKSITYTLKKKKNFFM